MYKVYSYCAATALTVGFGGESNLTVALWCIETIAFIVWVLPNVRKGLKAMTRDALARNP